MFVADRPPLAATFSGSIGAASAVLSAILLGVGLFAPTLQVKAFFFFEQTKSIVDVIIELFDQGDLYLGFVVLVFSVLFPASKLLVTLSLYFGPRPSTLGPRLKLLEALGKWSMMDVLVVALLIFAIKTSGIGKAVTMPGLYAFGASVILSMFAASRLAKLAESAPERSVASK